MASQQSANTATKENPEVKIAKKNIREKSTNSSMTRAVNVKSGTVIYKVSIFSKPTLTTQIFASTFSRPLPSSLELQ